MLVGAYDRSFFFVLTFLEHFSHRVTHVLVTLLERRRRHSLHQLLLRLLCRRNRVQRTQLLQRWMSLSGLVPFDEQLVVAEAGGAPARVRAIRAVPALTRHVDRR